MYLATPALNPPLNELLTTLDNAIAAGSGAPRPLPRGNASVFNFSN